MKYQRIKLTKKKYFDYCPALFSLKGVKLFFWFFFLVPFVFYTVENLSDFMLFLHKLNLYVSCCCCYNSSSSSIILVVKRRRVLK